MGCKRIAYSLCGEGFGHYGRSIGIIKNLSERFKDYTIDVYCYDYTFDMMSRDKNLPPNVEVHKIPGLRYRHNKKSKVRFFRTLLFSRRNWMNALVMMRVVLVGIFVKPLFYLFNKNTNIGYELTKDLVRDFEIAVVDWEPLLPRICKVRGKNYISIDSIHLLEYAQYRKEGFNLKDWYYLIINKILCKIYSPISKMSIITTIYNFNIKRRYKSKIYEVGPLVRKEIVDMADSIVYEDFILVYIRKVVRKNILPVIKEYTNEKFIIFTEHLTDEERELYNVPHIEFHDVDPKIFLDYLRRCKAVLSTSGYTLITESIILKKPFFAVVLGGILGFEQKLSLYSLRKSGCGDGCSIRRFKPKYLERFIANIDNYIGILKEKDFKDDTDRVSGIIEGVVRAPETFQTVVRRLNNIDTKSK